MILYSSEEGFIKPQGIKNNEGIHAIMQEIIWILWNGKKEV